MTRDQAILAWIEADKQLKHFKAVEMEARRQAFLLSWPLNKQGEPTYIVGTNTLELGRGHKLVCKTGYNYSLDNKDDKVDSVCQHLGADIAQATVKWKPELLLRGYKALSPEHKKLVDAVLTISPSTPSLSYDAPKGK